MQLGMARKSAGVCCESSSSNMGAPMKRPAAAMSKTLKRPAAAMAKPSGQVAKQARIRANIEFERLQEENKRLRAQAV